MNRGRVRWSREALWFNDATPRSPRGRVFSRDGVAGWVAVDVSDAPVFVLEDGQARACYHPYLVSRPQIGGLPSEVSRRVAAARRISRSIGRLDGLRVAPVRRLPNDERGPGHQVERGIFQYQDLDGRHVAAKDQIEARCCPARFLDADQRHKRLTVFNCEGSAPGAQRHPWRAGGLPPDQWRRHRRGSSRGAGPHAGCERSSACCPRAGCGRRSPSVNCRGHRMAISGA